MENVIVVVLFLVFVVGGLIKNYRETQQSQQRADERRLRKEDLPEATRRQIYGDETVPARTATVREATPRQAETPPSLPTQRPKLDPAAETARELFETLFGETTIERPVAQPPIQRRGPRPTPRPAASPPRPLVVQRHESSRQRPAASPKVTQRPRRIVIETQEGPAPPPPTPKPKRDLAQPAPVHAAAQQHKQRLVDLRLATKSDVRRAFVLAEILGRPRADRPFTGSFDERR